MADGPDYTIPPFPEGPEHDEWSEPLSTTALNSSGVSTASILITGIMLSVHIIWSRLRSMRVSVPQKSALDVPEIPDDLAQMQQM